MHPDDVALREKLGEALAGSLNEALWEGDRVHREALLKELRRLDAVPPADASLHEQLTIALLDSFSEASWGGDRERCDALLGELRTLCAAHPSDERLRQRLEALPAPPGRPATRTQRRSYVGRRARRTERPRRVASTGDQGSSRRTPPLGLPRTGR